MRHMSVKGSQKTSVNPDMEARNKLPIPSCYKKPTWIAAALPAFITFIVYLPTLQNGFVNWDDHWYVYENQNIISIDIEFLKWSMTTVVAALWHPLTMFSFAVDYAIWGFNPFGYHLTNILFHTANTFLVFVLVVRLAEGKTNSPLPLFIKDRARGYYSLIAASVSTLLFGIHPLHVESVAWVSERKDVLSAFFFLLTLLAYLKYTSAGGSRRPVFYAVCLLTFLLALMSKPMAVSLPAVLLILDYYPLGRLEAKKGINGILREKIPFFAFSLLSSLITIWASQLGEALQPVEDYPFIERLFTAGRAFVFYLVKMVLPFNLAPYYPQPVKIDIFTIEYMGSFMLLVVITIFCMLSLKRNKLFSAAWLYYIITLVPVIGIVKVGGHSMADRYTYLPSLGPFLLAGVGVAIFYGGRSNKLCRLTAIITLLFLSTILGIRTIKQIAVWKDSINLWSYEIKHFPTTVYKAYNNRGNAYAEQGRIDEAIEEYRTVLRLKPDYAEAYYNLGNAYFKQGRIDEATGKYKAVLRLKPDFIEAHYNLGLAYFKQGQIDMAIMEFTEVLRIRPNNTKAHRMIEILNK